MWLRGHVHVFLRALADIRVWDTPLRIVSAFTAYSTEFTEDVCVRCFFNGIVFPNVFCRVDVTEVQIAIVIMYLMTAFGGVSLWETRVRHSPSLASH